jgi:hypothetical protein
MDSHLSNVGASPVTEPLDPHDHPTESFPTTCWSLVQGAGHRAAPEARAALAALCTAYWYPLYALIRRKGYAPDDAQDLTQAYFARLLEKGVLAAADRSKGRFRAFLLTFRRSSRQFPRIFQPAGPRATPARRSAGPGPGGE